MNAAGKVDAGPRGHPALSRAFVPALDGVRGIAIICVLCAHLAITTGPTGRDADTLTRVMAAGWIGVDIFFALSGFLITGILLDTRGHARYFRNFYARRALRIFPLYYVFLAIAVWVAPAVDFMSPEDAAGLHHYQWWYWTYLTNVLVARGVWHANPWGMGPLWSLAVEEQFYLIWPSVVAFVAPSSVRRVAWGTILSAVALRFVLQATPVYPVALYALLFPRMDALAAGGLVAIVARDPARLRHWGSRIRPLALTALAVIVVIVVRKHEFDALNRTVQLIGYSALACLSGSLLIHLQLHRSGAVARFLEWPALRFFGRYSYAIYVIHLPIIVTLARLLPAGFWVPGSGQPLYPGRFIFMAEAVTVTLAVAWTSWRVLESPFLRLKRYFPD